MDKNFLQSEEWRKFQESAGHKTFNISGNNFHANIIEHKLPVVGRYFYIPRWSLARNSKSKILNPKQIQNSKFKIQNLFKNLVRLAKKEKAGWIRIDVMDENSLAVIKGFQIPLTPFSKGGVLSIKKAPHDMQPRQVFAIDISKTEEELLAEMKAKTRYNIRLSQKRGVSVKVISGICHPERSEGSHSNIASNNSTRFFPAEAAQNDKIEEFLRLVKITSKRNKIKSHPKNYYRKMMEIPGVKLYVAEYQGEIIAANIISFYGNTATYLHGASDNKYRNVMAPFLLQWQAILDAKKAGCRWYDMGGIKNQKSKIKNQNDNVRYENIKKSQTTNYKLQATSWLGITRFKLGFSPKTKPIEFLGSYDIVISPVKYWIYRVIQTLKAFWSKYI